MGLAISKYGAIKLTDEKPDFTTLKWVAMIVTTLLAGGGVFFSASEPITFLNHTSICRCRRWNNGSCCSCFVNELFALGLLSMGLPWRFVRNLAGTYTMKGITTETKDAPLSILKEKAIDSIWGKLADAFAVIEWLLAPLALLVSWFAVG